MNVPGKFGFKGISHKLGLLGLLITLAFGFIVVTVFIAFGNLERVTQQVTQADIVRVVNNADASRELSEIFGDIDLISRTFLDRSSAIVREAGEIEKRLNSLQRSIDDEALFLTLTSLKRHFSAFVAQCLRVNGLRAEQQMTDRQTLQLIQALEEQIARLMIRATLENGDTEYIDQLLTLVTGYRESVLSIGRLFAEQQLDYGPRALTEHRERLLVQIDDLSLRLLTINASRPAIAIPGRQISERMATYRRVVVELDTELRFLREQILDLELAKHITHTAMDRIDAASEKRAVSANASITQIVDQSRSTALVITLGVVLLVSLYMATIISRHINRPLRKILASIQQVSENRNAPLLKNYLEGEWGTIERALGTMARELRHSYDALEDSENRYRLLVENQADLIVKLSPDGTLQFASPSYCDTFAIEEQNAMGSPFLPDVHAEDQATLENALSTLIDHAGTLRLEVRARTRHDWRWLSWTARSVADESGKVTEIVAVGRDVTREHEARQEINFLAQHDALTRLPNRVLLHDRFELAIANARRSNTRIALMFLDLDRFKHINDSFGHDVGDQVLLTVVERLKDAIRSTDTISRQGGDEFILLTPEVKQLAGAKRIAETIQTALIPPIAVADRDLHTSFSIGISLYPDDGEDFETLMKNADTAMYAAKQAGRNTYRFFDENMNQEASEHLHLQSELRRSLEADGLELYYQPEVDLQTGECVAMEALCRWNSRHLGEVSPQRFIPVAEETGIINHLGDWVINEACRQGARWHQQQKNSPSVAVNLSAIQFRQGDIVKTVKDALTHSSLPPHRLELELTESLLLEEQGGIPETLLALKALGVSLAIDDFGTGYSSLSYLKRFSVNRLKVDKQFIHELTTDKEDEAIVRAIIQMAHSLQLEIVAEGVETQAQYDWLKREKCDRAQGYLTGYPLPARSLGGEPASENNIIPLTR